MQPHMSDTVFKVLSAAGTILGAWAIIRSYWLTRAKLVLRQKVDKGHNKFMDQGGQGIWMLKVLISNMSNQGNSVVGWNAWMKDKNGNLRIIRVPQGNVTDSKTGVVESLFNATPINVLPHATVEAALTFFQIKTAEYAVPLEIKVEAKDMYGKRYSCWCKQVLEASESADLSLA
jgi:hypothetical protein